MTFDYYNTYKYPLRLNGNNNMKNLVSSNKDIVNNNFDSSLFSETVLVDGVSYDVIQTQEKQSEDKKLLFKPDTVINKGAVVVMNNKNYLVTDFLSEGINSIYPTAQLKLCNSIYTIVTQPKIIGYDSLDNPIYDSTSPTNTDIPCIVESSIPSDSTYQAINLPENRLKITIPYTINSEIAIDKEFNMYNATYKIKGIDYTQSINQVGLMILTGERV